MIHIEMFLYFSVLFFMCYRISKLPKSNEISLKDEYLAPIRKIKKAWTKKDKFKPRANDDNAAFLKENSKD